MLYAGHHEAPPSLASPSRRLHRRRARQHRRVPRGRGLLAEHAERPALHRQRPRRRRPRPRRSVADRDRRHPERRAPVRPRRRRPDRARPAVRRPTTTAALGVTIDRDAAARSSPSRGAAQPHATTCASSTRPTARCSIATSSPAPRSTRSSLSPPTFEPYRATLEPRVGARRPVDIGVALYGDVQHSSGPVAERLVDTSMVARPRRRDTQTRWDTLRLANAQPSARPRSMVTAGDKPAAELDVVVVDAPTRSPDRGADPRRSRRQLGAGSASSRLRATAFIVGPDLDVHGRRRRARRPDRTLVRNCVDVMIPRRRPPAR